MSGKSELHQSSGVFSLGGDCVKPRISWLVRSEEPGLKDFEAQESGKNEEAKGSNMNFMI